jgi:20S proteasome alpha/beta subunit
MFRTVIWLLILATSANATIDIIVKTPECIVFASDGRSTYDNGAIASDTYEKIVMVTKYVMVQTAGVATPGNKNLKTTIQDFRWRYQLSDSSSLPLDSVLTFFKRYCKKNREAGVDYSGFFLYFAGADSQGNIQLHTYMPTADSSKFVKGYDILGVGNLHYYKRLLSGVDDDLKADIRKLLHTISADTLRNNQRLDSLSEIYQIVNPMGLASWSLQDAIDYAYTIVKTTLICDRMSLGKHRKDINPTNPVTGGEISLCVVTRDGVRWIIAPQIAPSR